MIGPNPIARVIDALRNAPVVPQPPDEPWSARIERMSVPGRIAEIDEETYDWFLVCLPPKWMGRGFAFAEGAEPLRYFWRSDNRYFFRQLTWDETKQFCESADISLPD